jgi:tRNA pseudouridine32 synthase/23S rRNA pseudouridine746 synthase
LPKFPIPRCGKYSARLSANVPAVPTQLYKLQITESGESALTSLARISKLPKQRIKDAMAKGAVWLRHGSTTRRMRRSTFTPRPGDELSLYYNPEVLALHAPPATLLADEKHYSVWIKPAGLLAQGTQEGDHCSLLRQVESAFKREVFLVHRLDREAAGLMLIAHTGKAAAALSDLFAAAEGQKRMNKYYQVEVAGQVPESGEITLPLDGKTALSRYTLVDYDAARNRSRVKVQLITGRKHQIRRHFADSGFPVIGDPVYGSGNKDARGMQLFAVELSFICPLTMTARNYAWTPANN